MVVLLISLFGHYFYVERAYAIAPLVRLGAGAVASEGVDAATNEIAEKIAWSFTTDKTSYTLESSQKLLDGVNKRLGDYEAWMETEEGQEWKNDVNEKWIGAGWEGDDVKVPETREEVIREATKTVRESESLGKKVVVRGIGGLLFLDMVNDVYQTIKITQGTNKFFDIAQSTPPSAGTRMGAVPGFNSGIKQLSDGRQYVQVSRSDGTHEASTVYFNSGVASYYFLVSHMATTYGVFESLEQYRYTVEFTIHALAGNGALVNTTKQVANQPLGNNPSPAIGEYQVLAPSASMPSIGTIHFPDGILPSRTKNPDWLVPYKPASPDSYPDKIVEIPISPVKTEVVQPSPTTVKDPTPQDDPNGLPKPAPDPEPEPSPNPEVKPNPLPTPIPTPVPVPQFPEPVPDLDDPPDDDDKKRFEDFKNLATSKFPFSLPWDLAYMVSALNAEPKTPHFKMDIDGSILGIKFPFDIDHNMSYLNGFMPFFRGLIVVGYCFMLILLTRQILGGGS